MGLTNAQVSSLTTKATKCGYDAVWAQVTYPPKGKIALPNNGKDVVAFGCDVDNQLYNYGAYAKSLRCCNQGVEI